jgi:5-methylcytosine-specific restriction endonuclease McrA
MAVARKRPTALQRVRIAFEQQYRCALCAQLLEPPWHIDHATPLSCGGTNDRANLQALCVPCHATKTAGEAAARPARRALKRRPGALQRLLRLFCRRGR